MTRSMKALPEIRRPTFPLRTKQRKKDVQMMEAVMQRMKPALMNISTYPLPRVQPTPHPSNRTAQLERGFAAGRSSTLPQEHTHHLNEMGGNKHNPDVSSNQQGAAPDHSSGHGIIETTIGSLDIALPGVVSISGALPEQLQDTDSNAMDLAQDNPKYDHCHRQRRVRYSHGNSQASGHAVRFATELHHDTRYLNTDDDYEYDFDDDSKSCSVIDTSEDTHYAHIRPAVHDADTSYYSSWTEITNENSSVTTCIYQGDSRIQRNSSTGNANHFYSNSIVIHYNANQNDIMTALSSLSLNGPPVRTTETMKKKATAAKFCIEQHLVYLEKRRVARFFRRRKLQEEMAKQGLSSVQQDRVAAALINQETEYLRLSRVPISLNDFARLQLLGRGAFGEVSLVRNRENGFVYAMKSMKKIKVLQLKQESHVKAERDILADADNEWVVRLFFAFQDRTHLYFVMEYVPVCINPFTST